MSRSTLFVSQGGSDSTLCTSANPCATVSHALTQAASGATIEVSGTIDDHVTISQPVKITTWPSGPDGSSAVLDGTEVAGKAVVDVESAGVTLHDLTIENADPAIDNSGTLTLTDSTVSGTTGALCGCAGIINRALTATMTVIDSTVTNNAARGIFGSGTMTVIASTVSGNTNYGIQTFNGGTVTMGATWAPRSWPATLVPTASALLQASSAPATT